MLLFYSSDIADQIARLDEDEAHHCIQVLRRQIGDSITLVDGRGGWYEATIIETGKKRCVVQIVQHIPDYQRRNHYLHLAIAPTKNLDRMEWLLEKATEIGIDEITFLTCQRSERRQLRLDRLEKIVLSAMKQSLRAYLPKLHPLTPFLEFVQAPQHTQLFIAHCSPGETPPHLQHVCTPGAPACVLIGPEGDFTAEEVEAAVASGFEEVSLGPHRLRTETAGLAACHIINLKNE